MASFPNRLSSSYHFYVLEKIPVGAKKDPYLPDCSLLLIKIFIFYFCFFRMSDTFPSDKRPLYAPFFSVMGASSAMIFRYVTTSQNVQSNATQKRPPLYNCRDSKTYHDKVSEEHVSELHKTIDNSFLSYMTASNYWNTIGVHQKSIFEPMQKDMR